MRKISGRAIGCVTVAPDYGDKAKSDAVDPPKVAGDLRIAYSFVFFLKPLANSEIAAPTNSR